MPPRLIIAPREGDLGAVRHQGRAAQHRLRQTVEWKDGIVGRPTSGVGALLKAPSRQDRCMAGPMTDGKSCRVETDTGLCHPAGHDRAGDQDSSPPLRLSLPFGGKVISSTEALS